MKRGCWKFPRWTEADTQTLRKLWREGKNDQEIGRVIGVTGSAIGYRRRALGMPAHHFESHSPESLEKISRAGLERWKNPEIAARMLAGLAKGRAAQNAERRGW